MKKIITLVFALIIFCGTCLAFEAPNPEQWTFLGEEGGYEAWFDRVSLEFSEGDDGLCANVWILEYRPDGKTSTMADFMINMEKKTMSLRTFSTFTEEKGETDYWEGPDAFRPLDGYTFGQDLYDKIAEIFASKHEIIADDTEGGH